ASAQWNPLAHAARATPQRIDLIVASAGRPGQSPGLSRISRRQVRSYGRCMPEFVVESYFSSEPASVAPRVDEIALAAERLSEGGVQVRFSCAAFLLEEEICFYLFQSPSADAVHEAVTRARLRFERITEAVCVRPRARQRSEEQTST